MTQEEITTGNKLIAEFIGFKLVPCNNGIAWDNNKIIKPISLHGSLEGHNNGKFHSSWDWLMPVVEKIEEHKYPETYQNSSDGPEIHDCAYMRTMHGKMARINRHQLFQAETLIKAVWLACVDFIKWDNNHKS